MKEVKLNIRNPLPGASGAGAGDGAGAGASIGNDCCSSVFFRMD